MVRKSLKFPNILAIAGTCSDNSGSSNERFGKTLKEFVGKYGAANVQRSTLEPSPICQLAIAINPEEGNWAAMQNTRQKLKVYQLESTHSQARVHVQHLVNQQQKTKIIESNSESDYTPCVSHADN